MRKRTLRTLSWLRDRGEDVLAIIFWDGGWKPPRKDRRNGL